jgi:transposase-like protein
MASRTYSGYRFPRDVIHRAIWMYLRFTLSYRDIEDLLAERGIEVSYETIRRWVITLGPMIARRLRARRPAAYGRWHLDEGAPGTLGQRCPFGAAYEMREPPSEPAVRGRLQTASSCGGQELPW